MIASLKVIELNIFGANKEIRFEIKKKLFLVLIEDHGSDSKLNFCQFVRVFATFRRGKTDLNASNTKTNKLKFLFRMYDRGDFIYFLILLISINP